MSDTQPTERPMTREERIMESYANKLAKAEHRLTLLEVDNEMLTQALLQEREANGKPPIN